MSEGSNKAIYKIKVLNVFSIAAIVIVTILELIMYNLFKDNPMVFNLTIILILVVFLTTIYFKQAKLSKEILAAYESAELDSNNSSRVALMQAKNIDIYAEIFRNFKNIVSTAQTQFEKSIEIANTTIDMTKNSANTSEDDQKLVRTNVEKMESLKTIIQTIAELILNLSDYIHQISSTVGVVEDVAEQTNMLALNAAVEAARAGEHGKGFAVVAGEIRKLADTSKQATSKISALIADTQQTTNSTVLATEECIKEIESGISLVGSVEANLLSLTKNIYDILNLANDFSGEVKYEKELIQNLLSSISEAEIQVASNDVIH